MVGCGSSTTARSWARRSLLGVDEVELLIERVLAPLGRRVDPVSPMVDARLPDGSRVNVVVPPLAVDGPCVTIRRFSVRALALDDLAAPPVAELLRWAVSARSNIVVVGATGSGKTTLLNALAGRGRGGRADHHRGGRGRAAPARSPRGAPRGAAAIGGRRR